MNTVTATSIVESLRNGIPPRFGVTYYSVGHEHLLDGIKKRHLSGIDSRGILRFISGSWGAGKTHFFRLLREVAFDQTCLVSTVELKANDDATLNRFESVFYAIIRNIEAPSQLTDGTVGGIAPFGRVLYETLCHLATGSRSPTSLLTYEHFLKADEQLMSNQFIDIDFKKMVQAYWKTFLPDAGEPILLDRNRAEILQWFGGEGSLTKYRQLADVHKMIKKENARLILQSLSGFVQLAGYRGLVILFDEAEKAFSVMRKSALRDAHNNLLSLINNIESLPGLFFVYATVPEFFTDPKHGIVIYGALAGRIGKPEEKEPRALRTIWNFDAVETTLDHYQDVAGKLRTIYANAYPDIKDEIPSEEAVSAFVAELDQVHPQMAPVRFWRVLVKALITYFDDHLEGDTRPTEDLYYDVMDSLRES